MDDLDLDLVSDLFLDPSTGVPLDPVGWINQADLVDRDVGSMVIDPSAESMSDADIFADGGLLELTGLGDERIGDELLSGPYELDDELSEDGASGDGASGDGMGIDFGATRGSLGPRGR